MHRIKFCTRSALNFLNKIINTWEDLVFKKVHESWVDLVVSSFCQSMLFRNSLNPWVSPFFQSHTSSLDNFCLGLKITSAINIVWSLLAKFPSVSMFIIKSGWLVKTRSSIFPQICVLKFIICSKKLSLVLCRKIEIFIRYHWI